MEGWLLFVVVHDDINGACCYTLDMEVAVDIAFEHRGACSVLIIGIQAARAEKRTVHKDADKNEIRQRIQNGIQFVSSHLGEQLC